MQRSLADLLQETIEREGSDLHLVVGKEPTIRIRGELTPLDGEKLTKADTESYAKQVANDGQLEKLEAEGGIDLAHGIESGDGRRTFRLNVSTPSGGNALVFRLIPRTPPTPEQLDLTDPIMEMIERPQGLLLVTGATGSGKSTTLASILTHIASTGARRIVTLEQPIEYLFEHGNSVVTQFDVPSNVPSFATALRSILRQDPDVIMVGELRDHETIEVTLNAAETGHLVLATLHTNSAAESIDRIINMFPIAKKEEVRTVLSAALLGVMSQRLLPHLDQDMRVLAYELLVKTPKVEELILAGDTGSIAELIETDDTNGMRGLDQHLYQLVEAHQIDRREARAQARNPERFERWLRGVHT